MEPKSVVVKSKSSNNAIASKNDKRNKFSRSDVEFHPLNMKKRGVYVENKENNVQQNVFDNKEEEIKRKPPPRPRPGQKRFLTSVLNILSKSTTGTQYPDNCEYPPPIPKKFVRHTQKLKKNTSINKNLKQDLQEEPEKEIEVLDQEVNVNLKVKNKKPKYKSKVLNNNQTSVNDKFVILQSRKEIIHTPSNYSEMSKNFTINESKNPIRELLENNIYSGVAEGLAKEILEGNVTDKPLKILDDPSTLVADVPKDDKKIYNFFVDLLETTFDVYNVNTDTITKMDSDTILEIDETVANKLNTKNEHVTTCRSREHHELNFDIKADKPYVPLSESLPQKPSKVKKAKQKKLKTRSFIYSKPVVQKPSRELKRKPLSKAAKRKDLLNTIKEELKMDINRYEEPQNLYQALRNMAKYKRKCQAKRTIQFDIDYKNKNFNRECLFSQGIFPMRRLKRRKLNQPEPKAEKKISDFRNRFLRTPRIKPVPVESNHSLEVFGIEYESKETAFEKRQYEMVLSSDSEVEINQNTIMGISDSSINMKRFFSLIDD